jgi:hypothetical protein
MIFIKNKALWSMRHDEKQTVNFPPNPAGAAGRWLPAAAPAAYRSRSDRRSGAGQFSFPTATLPDLVVSSAYLGMQGVPTYGTECIPSYAPYEIRTMVRNLGEATASNIVVADLSTGTFLILEELGAGQGAEVVIPLAYPKDTYNLVVDPQNTISESNEGNNTFSYLAITPTPPVLCTTAPSPSSDLATPEPYSEPESAALSQALLLNSTYRSPDWGEFQLQEGIYYRAPPNELESAEVYTTRFIGPILYGDINADGFEDALVILSTQNGGTGHFVELAAVLNENGNARQCCSNIPGRQGGG